MLARFFKIRKVAPLESVKVFRKALFCFINDLSAFLPSSIRCSLYADDLAIWLFSPSVPAAVGATQGALIQMDCRIENWCSHSIRANVRPPSSPSILTKVTSSPIFSYSTSPSASIPLVSWGHVQLHSLLFQTSIFAEGRVFPSSQGLMLYLCFLIGSL